MNRVGTRDILLSEDDVGMNVGMNVGLNKTEKKVVAEKEWT